MPTCDFTQRGRSNPWRGVPLCPAKPRPLSAPTPCCYPSMPT
ncbi:hypothetical protein [Lysobacter gummosus]